MAGGNGGSSQNEDLYTYCSAVPSNDTTNSEINLAYKIIGVVNVIAAAPTFAMNLCVLIAIMRTNALRTKTNGILCCILILNILQGCITLPVYGVIVIRIAENKADCLAREVVGYFGASFALISMLSVDLLTYERYIAIRNPFQHETRFTKTRIKVAVAGIWMTSLAVMASLKSEKVRVVAISFATLVTVGTYVFNVAVHILIYRTVQKLRNSQNALHANVADASSQAALEQQRKERRTVKFSLYVIFFLLACYLPSVLKNVFVSVKLNQNVFTVTANTILTMHATFSPLLYVWQSPPIGRAVKRLMPCNASVHAAAP